MKLPERCRRGHHPFGTAKAAMAMWIEWGFAPAAVVCLDSYGTIYAWGDVDGSRRLVVFTARFVSWDDGAGVPLVWVPPKWRAAHWAMRPGDDSD